MEFGRIEREITIDAGVDVVYDVVSDPVHVRQWWPDDANFEAAPGSTGTITFGTDADATVESFTVVEADPPRRFAFRWTHPSGSVATAGNSLLVVFELIPRDGGTLLLMTETGFREMGWEAAVLEQQYAGHVTGWDFYLPRLAPYAESVGNQS